ncbi:hypothetical protein H4K35_11240 [Myroides sp. NP-2]|nr:hypothetical protein [Myroides sp. NP-2]
MNLIDPTGMRADPPIEGEFENGYVHTDSDGSWTYNNGIWSDNSGGGNDFLEGINFTVPGSSYGIIRFVSDFTGGSQAVQIDAEARELSRHSDGSTDWAAYAGYSLMMEKATNPGNLEIGRNLLRTPVKTKYHYTTEAGFNSIMETKTLNPSIGAKNARFGSGQYFTDIAPGSFTKG